MSSSMSYPIKNPRFSLSNDDSIVVTLVTEAYNLAEGQSEASFLRALRSVADISKRYRGVEVLVLDPTTEHVAAPILDQHHPSIKALHVPGQSYDGQKNVAAMAARGEFLVFLDGDCVPVHEDWLQRILSPFENEHIHAVGGLTIYEGEDLRSKAMTILDFGFLFEPNQQGHLGCYAFNNVAFRRAAYLQVMAPDDGELRCYCYKHAQLLARAHMPVHANHHARALHELPDVRKERLRRGYDHAATLWEDPVLPGAASVGLTDNFVNMILQQETDLAMRRIDLAPPFLGINASNKKAVVAEIKRLLELDREGLLQALHMGERLGANARARQAHAASRKPQKPKIREVTLRSLARLWPATGR